MAETVRVCIPFHESTSVADVCDATRPDGLWSRLATRHVRQQGGTVEGEWSWEWTRPGRWDPAEAANAAYEWDWRGSTASMWLAVGTAPGRMP